MVPVLRHERYDQLATVSHIARNEQITCRTLPSTTDLLQPMKNGVKIPIEFHALCLEIPLPLSDLSECTSEPYRPDRSKSSLELPASWLSFDPHKLPVVFHFQALLSTPNRTLASDWVRLTIVAGDSPLVEIVCRENCGEDVNPSETVILSFSCSNCGDKERLNKSWDIRRDHPDISKTNLSDFLKSNPKMDGDVFAIPAQVFESTERDEVLIVSLQGSSIHRI